MTSDIRSRRPAAFDPTVMARSVTRHACNLSNSLYDRLFRDIGVFTDEQVAVPNGSRCGSGLRSTVVPPPTWTSSGHSPTSRQVLPRRLRLDALLANPYIHDNVYRARTETVE